MVRPLSRSLTWLEPWWRAVCASCLKLVLLGGQTQALRVGFFFRLTTTGQTGSKKKKQNSQASAISKGSPWKRLQMFGKEISLWFTHAQARLSDFFPGLPVVAGKLVRTSGAPAFLWPRITQTTRIFRPRQASIPKYMPGKANSFRAIYVVATARRCRAEQKILRNERRHVWWWWTRSWRWVRRHGWGECTLLRTAPAQTHTRHCLSDLQCCRLHARCYSSLQKQSSNIHLMKSAQPKHNLSSESRNRQGSKQLLPEPSKMEHVHAKIVFFV